MALALSVAWKCKAKAGAFWGSFLEILSLF
jgi:hypothetical protein